MVYMVYMFLHLPEKIKEYVGKICRSLPHGNLWIEADLGLAEQFDRHLPGEIELKESRGSVVQFF